MRSHERGRRGIAAALAVAGACAALPAVAVDDTMAQRVLACTGCHGAQGRAARDGYYPRIAGKPAGYLYHQLLNFRDGRRHYALMRNLIAPLSDAYLREIADHFAGLDVPYAASPPAPAAPLPATSRPRGEQLVRHGDPALQLPACAACHGAALMGVLPAIPALLGVPPDYVNAQLGAWRIGTRQAQAPDCMAQVARRLAPDDIAAVAQWLAAQPVPPMSGPATSLPAPLPLDCGGVDAAVRSASRAAAR